MKYIAVFGMVVTLAACQTVEGFGEDVEAGGEIIQDTSNNVQREI